MAMIISTVVVTVMFAGILASLALAGAWGWVVVMIASVAVVIFASKTINRYFQGPIPMWGYGAIALVVFLYMFKASPWYVRDAVSRRSAVSGMSFADDLRPANPVKLEETIFATKDKALRLQEDTAVKETNKIYEGMPETGEFTHDQKISLNKAEAKLDAIRKEREQLKLQSSGSSSSARSTRNNESIFSQKVTICEMEGPGKETYPVSEEWSQFELRSDLYSTLYWSPNLEDVEVVFPDGRRYISGFARSNYMGDHRKNRVFRYRSLKGGEGSLTVVASNHPEKGGR